MPDMAGEALMEEINHPRSYPVVRSFLERCGATLLLVDASRLAEGDKDQDFHSMKIVSYLLELDGHPKRGWPQRPVAVIFSKADQCGDCFEDPEQFAKRNAPGLWRHCQERLKRHKFFAVGVAGECAHRWEFGGRVHVPLRIEPRGIVEPFTWLLQQLK
jgi:hypothetical protein